MDERKSVNVQPHKWGYRISVQDMDRQIGVVWVPASWMVKPAHQLMWRRWKRQVADSKRLGLSSAAMHERDMQWAERVIKGTQGVRTIRPRLQAWSAMLGYDHDRGPRLFECGMAPDDMKPNLYSSRLPDGTHMPILDLDYGAQLVPSRTNGHWHLYLEKAISWDNYKKLLETMAEVGLIEPGYVSASIENKMTLVRIPPMQVLADQMAEEMGELISTLA